MKKTKITTTLILLVSFSLLLSATVFASNSDNNWLPGFLKPGHKTPPPMGERDTDSQLILYSKGVKILETTTGDFFTNREFYYKKYGIGKYWRSNHSPIEPLDIKYKPNFTAESKGYPKVFVGKDK